MSCRRATNRNKLDVCVLWASVARVVRVLIVSHVRYHVLWFDGFQVFGQSRQQKAVRLDLECFDDVICPAMKIDVAEINIGIQPPKHKRQ